MTLKCFYLLGYGRSTQMCNKLCMGQSYIKNSDTLFTHTYTQKKAMIKHQEVLTSKENKVVSSSFSQIALYLWCGFRTVTDG